MPLKTNVQEKFKQKLDFLWGTRPLACLVVSVIMAWSLQMGMALSSAAANQPEAEHTKDFLHETNNVKHAIPKISHVWYGQKQMGFEPNIGQTHENVQFMARGGDYTVFLTPAEAVLVFPSNRPRSESKTRTTNELALTDGLKNILRLQVLDANPTPAISGLEEMPGTINHLIGHKKTQWQTNVPVYEKVQYREIYPGIDLLYYGNQQQLEYDFIVHPGAQPSDITMGIHGADHATLDAEGHLLLKLPSGTLRLQKPMLTQTVAGKIRDIGGSFVLRESNSADPTTPPIQVAFEVGTYDRTLPLIIDPLVNYASAFGGEGEDRGEAIAVDNAGHSYIVGSTDSFRFPVTANAFQDSAIGTDRDVFVTKFNTETSEILFSTYIGGEGNDRATGVAVDMDGIPYVIGETTSLTFPTQHALQGTLQGESDAFVLKLAPDGSHLVYSTYLGGRGPDHANGIVVDAQGQASVTGATTSPDFPTVNAIHATLGTGETTPQSDIFVSTLDAQGTTVLFSTFLGGAGADVGHNLTLDAQGKLYLTGATGKGAGFPVTAGAFQPTYGGGETDAFIATIDPNIPGPNALVYASYLGGSGEEVGLDLLLNAEQQVFITGWTTGREQTPVVTASRRTLTTRTPVIPWGRRSSPLVAVNPARGIHDLMRGLVQQKQPTPLPPSPTPSSQLIAPTLLPEFPVTSNAFDATFNGEKDAFVAQVKVVASGQTGLVYATYVGGSENDMGTAIGIDTLGRVCITGTTNSPDYPIENPFEKQGTLNGGTDLFLSKFKVEISSLLFSSFLGGSANEIATDMALDNKNFAFLTGHTFSKDFPLFPDQDRSLINKGADAIILKIQDPVNKQIFLRPLSVQPAQVGVDQTWRLSWGNLGPDTATNVKITLSFDPGRFPHAVTGLGGPIIKFKAINRLDNSLGSCRGPSQSIRGGTRLICNVSDLSPNEFGSAEIVFTPLAEGNYRLEAQSSSDEAETDFNSSGITLGNGTPPEDILTIGPAPPPAVSLEKTVATQPVRLGFPWTYEISVRNIGLIPIVNAQIFDDLERDIIPLETAKITKGSCRFQLEDEGGDDLFLVCEISNFDPGETITITYTVFHRDIRTERVVQNQACLFSPPGFANPPLECSPILRTNLNLPQAPNGMIDTPIGNQSIPVGGTISFMGSATDLDSTEPLSHLWTFGAGSNIPNSTASDPGNIKFSTPGMFTVTYLVTDADGLSDRTPPTVTITVNPIMRDLTVVKTPPNGGTVRGTGISCGNDCKHTANQGTVITLEAEASTGFTFAGWSGNPTANCPETGPCAVMLDTNRTVAASFVRDIVIVPTVVGQLQSSASTALTNAGLVIGSLTEQPDLAVETGVVIKQNPAAGTSVNSGSTVSLVVSSGSGAVVTNPDDGPDSNPNDGMCGSNDGNGGCTLRAAIQEANALKGSQTILLSPGNYILTVPGANEEAAATGDLDLIDDVIIASSTGNAADVIISASGLDRIFDLPQGSPNVILQGLTIQGGKIMDSTGGGIRNVNGNLTLENSVIRNNQSDRSGGGISHLNGSLIIQNTTVSNNTSQGRGGGLQVRRGTVAIFENSQFSENQANLGGGISTDKANVRVINSTVTGNTAPGGGGGIFKFLHPGDVLPGFEAPIVRLEGTTSLENNTPNDCEGYLLGDPSMVGNVGGTTTRCHLQPNFASE